MKIYTNKKYNTISAYIIGIVTICIIIAIAIFRLNKILSIVSEIFHVLSPIIWGVVIAYLLNPIMIKFEKLLNKCLFKKKAHPVACRRISVTITMLITITALGFLLYLALPELISSITAIPDKISPAIDRFKNWMDKTIENPDLVNTINEKLDSITTLSGEWKDRFMPIATSLTSSVWSFILGLKDFFIGIFASIYLLLAKEKFIAQVKKVFFALSSKKTVQKTLILFRKSNDTISGFITGKIIDSIIIGILCFIGLNIIGLDNNCTLISVIIGVTNVIPFFGPFIGAIPSAFIILIDQPTKLIAFIIFIFLLQQFDGNILGPRILGDSTGLPAFWVLFSILLGGGLFGFAGMLLGVPVFAVFYALFRSYIETRLEAKNMPTSTAKYIGNVDHYYKVVRAKDMKAQKSSAKNTESNETTNEPENISGNEALDNEKDETTTKIN